MFSNALSTRQPSVWLTNKSLLKEQKSTFLEETEHKCVCVCVFLWKTDKKGRLGIVFFTPSVTSACIHRLMHLVYLQLQSLFRKKRITAGVGNERMSSRRTVLIFMSQQSRLICFSLWSRFFLYDSLYQPTCLCHWLCFPPLMAPAH